MSLFGNLSTEGTEATEDRLGGGYKPLDTDIYTGKIKVAYAGQSAGGARSVTLILSEGDFGQNEYRETTYVTNRKGENFYVKDGKKYQLPGFITMDQLCQATVGKNLSEMNGEDKMVNIYDPELKKAVPKSVPVLIELVGQEVSLAIVQNIENKSEKVGDKYVPIADTREVNVIQKVFNTQHRMTVSEAMAKQKDPNFVPTFWDDWLKKNKGEVFDRTDPKAGQASGQSGRPGGGAPQGGNVTGAAGGTTSDNSGSGTPRSSLFGNK